MSCEDHQGTDCTSWKYLLGENITALQQLIDGCPVSCNIPCGAFSQQLIDLSFIVSDISGLLDVVTQTPLEEVALDYLTDYVDANYKGEEFTFVLETVNLKSQERLLPQQRLRALQETTSMLQLRVVLTLFGFSIGVDSEQLTQLLIGGVDSVGFTQALQASSKFYESAQASSAVRQFPKAVETVSNDEPQSDSVPAVTITVAALAGVAVLALAVAFLVSRYRKYGSSRELRVDVEDSPVSQASSSNVYSFSNSVSSPYSSVNSPRGTRFYHTGNMLGSLSRSRDSNDDENSILTEKHIHSPDHKRKLEYDEKKKHPLAGVVPAMMVIDGIDGEKEEMENDHSGTPIVPARRFFATSSLKRALTKPEGGIPLDLLG